MSGARHQVTLDTPCSTRPAGRRPFLASAPSETQPLRAMAPWRAAVWPSTTAGAAWCARAYPRKYAVGVRDGMGWDGMAMASSRARAVQGRHPRPRKHAKERWPEAAPAASGRHPHDTPDRPLFQVQSAQGAWLPREREPPARSVPAPHPLQFPLPQMQAPRALLCGRTLTGGLPCSTMT